MERHTTTGEGRDNDNNTNNPNNPSAARHAARSQPGVPALTGLEAGESEVSPTALESFSPRPGSAERQQRQRPRGAPSPGGRGEVPAPAALYSHRLHGHLLAPLLRPYGAARVKSEKDKKGAKGERAPQWGRRRWTPGGIARSRRWQGTAAPPRRPPAAKGPAPASDPGTERR